jgi:hypothetical protein
MKNNSHTDSLVGIMMRAKRRKKWWYDGDTLFQGRDDGVVIYIHTYRNAYI